MSKATFGCGRCGADVPLVSGEYTELKCPSCNAVLMSAPGGAVVKFDGNSLTIQAKHRTTVTSLPASA